MTPSKTYTGGYPIGFRRGGGGWQQAIESLASWAAENGFGFVDISKGDSPAALAPLSKAGLAAGQVDLLDWHGYQAIITADAAQRQDIVAQTAAHIEASAAAGATNFFSVTIPADQSKPRKENFGYLVEGYGALIPALERANARVAIEGWPGPAAVCCTPETYRAFFKEIGSDRFGINYDPSHLLRMGIDPLRFLKEFVDRVYHVHGKDTAISGEDLYEYGTELPRTLAESPGWGGGAWRYTIPGHGLTDWPETFRVLKAGGYQGGVSIELEDQNFNGTDAGEQRGLIKSREFLEGC